MSADQRGDPSTAQGGATRQPARPQLLWKVIRKTAGGQAKDMASAIAFWAFFSIFPLLIGVLSLAGYYIESAQLFARIHEVVSEMLPGSAALVNDHLDAVVRHRGTMSLVGIGGLLWTAGKGFGAITRGVNQAIGAKRPHSFLLSKVRHFFMALSVSSLLVVSVGLTLAIEVLIDSELLSKLGLEAIHLPRLEGWITSFLLVFAMFALIYKLAPYVDVSWAQVLPGALLGALAFELGKAAFVFYLDRMAHFEAVYGSLSSIIVLLLWLYISARVLIVGAEYNIVRERARRETVEETHSSQGEAD